MKLVKIAGDTYYVPGMTNVGVYRDYVIDPGKNKYIDWASPEASLGGKISIVVITHAHQDHFWHALDLRTAGAKVYAPAGERAKVENTSAHINGFFYWVRPPSGMKPWYFQGRSCPTDGSIEELEMPFKTVPLPGHTDHQTGYLTPDGVLFSGDAMVAKEVWETAGIFYHTSLPDTRQTLRKLMDTDADWVLPTHSEPLQRQSAQELAEANLKGLDRLETLIIDTIGKDSTSTEEIISKVCVALNMKDEFSVHLVGETTIRMFLHSLCEDRLVEYELKGHKVYWRMI